MGKIIVLDTNIWISYGFGRNLKEFKYQNEITFLTCQELRSELINVINRSKFYAILNHSSKALLVNFFDAISVSRPIERTFKGSSDPNDDFLFDLTIQYNADFLVTGDKKLLDFELANLKIISLHRFREQFLPQS